MKIYRGELAWHLGVTQIAVEAANIYDARTDLYSAAEALTRTKIATMRMKNIRRSTRKYIAAWTPIKGCHTNGQPWAWSGPHKGA